jgi:hypothetical protein
MYGLRGLGDSALDVMCPDGSIVGPGVLCGSQAPSYSTSNLPVAYGSQSSPVAVPQTLTMWMNSNSTMLLVAAAGMVFTLAMAKGGR